MTLKAITFGTPFGILEASMREGMALLSARANATAYRCASAPSVDANALGWCGTCVVSFLPKTDAESLWRAGWVRYFHNGELIWICPACEPKGFTPDGD